MRNSQRKKLLNDIFVFMALLAVSLWLRYHFDDRVYLIGIIPSMIAVIFLVCVLAFDIYDNRRR